MTANRIQFNGEYRQRLVAFIDILGFSERIRTTRSRPAEVTKIAECLEKHVRGDEGERRVVYGFELDDDGEVLPSSNGVLAAETAEADFRQSTFSDNIVMSVETNVGGLNHLADQCGNMILELMKQGLYCRGSITLGDLLHEQNVVFGPALVEAANIEKGIADFPRVLASADVVDFIYREHDQHPRERIEAPQPAKRFMWCEDGPCMLNPFHGLQGVLGDLSAFKKNRSFPQENLDKAFAHYQEEARDMRRHLVEQLRAASHQPSHFRKLKWLGELFNFELARRPVMGKPLVEEIYFNELFKRENG